MFTKLYSCRRFEAAYTDYATVRPSHIIISNTAARLSQDDPKGFPVQMSSDRLCMRRALVVYQALTLVRV